MHWKIQGFYNSMDGWVDMSVICFTSSFSFLFLLSSLSIPPFALPLPLFLFHCRMGIGVNGARLDALSAHDWVFAMFSSWILWFWCIFYHFPSLEDYSWGINWFIFHIGGLLFDLSVCISEFGLSSFFFHFVLSLLRQKLFTVPHSQPTTYIPVLLLCTIISTNYLFV